MPQDLAELLHMFQVEQQERACRRVLERALTRAAVDHDLGAIDDCEGTMKHREQKLERLLTHKHMLDFEEPLVCYLMASITTCYMVSAAW